MAAKSQAEPQRLLFVFLRSSLPNDHSDEEATRFHSGQGGGVQPIMCVDKTLDELGSFTDLVMESDRIEKNWQIVLVAGLSGKNGVLPNSDETALQLERMAQAADNGGDLSSYMAFDKKGSPLQFGP